MHQNTDYFLRAAAEPVSMHVDAHLCLSDSKQQRGGTSLVL